MTCSERVLTNSHPLQRTDHQAVIDLPFDPLCECLIFLCVLGYLHQQLTKCVATNREGMDKQRAGDEAITLQQIQQPLSMLQTPARPQELLHLV